MSEVSEKVQFIQESLQRLDSQLGQLQDLSALAVDTLKLLSASDNRQQEVELLGQSRHFQQLSHSWSLRVGGTVTPSNAPPSPKAYRSTPPSLLRLATGRAPRASIEDSDSRLQWVLGNLDTEPGATRRRLGGDSSAGLRLSHGSLPQLWPDLSGSPVPSCGSSVTTVWAHDTRVDSMEEEEEEEDDVFSDTDKGIVNPAFCGDSDSATPKAGRFGRKWSFAMERELQHCRSLSASVETMASTLAKRSTSGGDVSPPAGLEHKGNSERSR